jgi:hypothetical protein
MNTEDDEPWGRARLADPGVSHWDAHEVKTLRSMVHDDATDESIATALGRTPRAVAVKRQRLGLTIRTLGQTSRGIASLATNTLLAELKRRGFTVEGYAVRRGEP